MGINITLSNKRILLIMEPLFMQTLSVTFPKIFPFPKTIYRLAGSAIVRTEEPYLRPVLLFTFLTWLKNYCY
jgi:hypothetical protein